MHRGNVNDKEGSDSGQSDCTSCSLSQQIIDDASPTVDVNTVGKNEDVAEEGGDPSFTTDSSDKKASLFSRAYHYIYLARLEVFFFVYVFSRMMVSTPIGDLLLQKACLNDLHNNASICGQLDSYPEIKDAAEKIGSTCGMYRIGIAFGPSALVAVFIGPWCDKYGYKTPLLISNIGAIISTVLVLATAYMMALPLLYDILAAIPDGLSGGFIAVFMAVYADATVSTKGAQRRTKFFLLSVSSAVAMPLAGLIGGQIYGRFGIRVVLQTSVCLLVICQLWIMFVLTVPERAKLLNDSVWTKLRSFFQLKNFLEGFRACARERPDRGRAQLWLLFSAQTILVADMTASVVSYYYVRKMYSWSVAHFTTVSAVSSGVTYIFYAPIMLLFTRVFKVSDLWMAIIGASFTVAQMAVCGLAYTEWLYYVQYAVGIPTFLSSVGLRTHLSKLLDDNELGRVFSFSACFESIVPIAGEVMFTKIFQWSLDFFPGLVYLVAAVLSVGSVLLLGCCIFVSSNSHSAVDTETEGLCEDNFSVNT